MPLRLEVDARLAELVYLDVLDVTPEGSLRLNESFFEACLSAYESDPGCLGDVFQSHILARAMSRGLAGCIDVDELALAALEVAATAEEPDAAA